MYTLTGVYVLCGVHGAHVPARDPEMPWMRIDERRPGGTNHDESGDAGRRVRLVAACWVDQNCALWLAVALFRKSNP